MRKLIWLAAALATLAVVGAAVAHGRGGTGVKAVAAHFTAAPTSKTTTRTCTGPDGHVWHLTRGVYTGASTGDLAGSITIRTQSTIDTTTGLGFTKGSVELRDATSHKRIASARISAVNTHDGVLDGLLEGRTRDGMLLANVTARFTSDGSALSGDIGSQSSGTNSAVVYAGAGCHNRMHPLKKKPTPPPPRR